MATIRGPLRNFLVQQKPENYFTRIGHIVSICVSICCDPPALTAERRAVCASLAGPLAEAIDLWDKKQAHTLDDDEFDDDDDRFGERRTGVVERIIRIFGTISEADRLEQFLDHVLANKQSYKLRTVLVADIKEIYKWALEVSAARPAASRLLQHCLSELRGNRSSDRATQRLDA